MQTTKPQVFIIESLEFADEEADKFEGRRIADVLALSGKDCRYVYIRTKAELKLVLDHFWESKYRYLHLSCHGSESGMETTLETIPIEELAQILEPYLENRRLFLSACEMTSSSLAKQLIPKSECYSILGPSKKVDMADAAVFWSSFYHKVFRLNSEKVNLRRLLFTATLLSAVFSIPLNLFFLHKGARKKLSINPSPSPGKDVLLKWAINKLPTPKN